MQVRVGPHDASTITEAGARILVNSVCGTLRSTGNGKGGKFTFDCLPTVCGRFVSVQKLLDSDDDQADNKNYLEINEVTVFRGTNERLTSVLNSNCILQWKYGDCRDHIRSILGCFHRSPSKISHMRIHYWLWAWNYLLAWIHFRREPGEMCWLAKRNEQWRKLLH